MKSNHFVFLLVFVLFSVRIQAQLCTGSLGDPVVKLDFGSGTATHGAALGSGITSYTYTSADFPSDGSYTIESRTNTSGTWWTTTDHTGGGYMMVVNASFSTTDYFYKNTVTGLCPGTTYEFAAWIMNLLVSRDNSPPNITFTIEDTSGTILGSYNTGDIGLSSSATWKQYGFYFTTPSGVSTVVIRMRNNKVGAAPGNDIALDDITFRACGPTVTSAIQNESTTNLEVCENESRQITLSGAVTSSAYATVGYQWQTSTDGGTTWTDISEANSANYTFTSGAAGTFKYRLATADSSNISSSNCRVFSNEITIVVKSGSVAPTFTSVQPTCDLPSGTINIATAANTTYSIDGVNYQVSGVFSGLAGGDYNVTAKLNSGCASSPVVAHINSVATSSVVPTYSVIQPVICTNPYGTITVTSSNAEYSFDNGQTWQSSNVKTGLIPGDYLVKTRNSSLCETAAATVNIAVPPGYPPTPTVTVVQPDCIVTTGIIAISDVAAAYSFDGGTNWGTANFKNNLVAGTYQVLIKNNLGCVSLVPATVVVNPYVNNEPLAVAASPQQFCVQDNKTLNDIVVSGTNIKWYDAPTSGNLLSGTTILTNKTYYASQTISICESERIPVTINIQTTVAPTGNSTQNFCSTQNATISFLEATGIAIVWYDAATNGAILDGSTPLINGKTYYASQTINGCASVNRLAVTVVISSPTLVVHDVADSFCDDLNDGGEIVDLLTYNSTITSDSSAQIRYYSSLVDAQNQNSSGEIVVASTYNLQTGVTTLYARVDSNDKCYQVVKVVLTLFSNPVIAIADEVSLCENSNVSIDAGAGFDSYLWSTGETTQSINVSDVGNYSVTVTKNNGTVTCSTTHNFSVALSNVATISSIDVTDWTDNQNTITVHLDLSSLGDYEYSLDGIYYQDENVFTGLLSGAYTVYVRDKNGCGVSPPQLVYILNYPKFFTPNGDGYNDTWAVKLSETESNLKTRIFDRYGKFLKEFGNTSSWDGTFNGRQLPSDDYWFEVFRENNKIFRGHFALKR